MDDKLDNFARIVMREAAEKRVQIIESIRENRLKVLEQKELEFLEQAYLTIQKEIRRIHKEKNEMISRASMESKKMLLQKREEIIDEIFSNIHQKVIEFIRTPGYLTFLSDSIKEGCKITGDGEIVVYINRTDVHLIDRIKENLGFNMEIQVEQTDIIGGCKIFNKTKNILVDNSLAAKIQQQREQFLEISGLVIGKKQ
ncbi:V-type ATP synthase subunit E [Petroclostridium xylanilyticum]|uniref:V-type ATP synthase subunit E n=1 Tax=Petroclostridium xylanilyticum TaxID=1792311 RepID=UPI0018E3A51C|nr:V-type ATP synthase subunit E [Petroclostridium xylanilyticum]